MKVVRIAWLMCAMMLSLVVIGGCFTSDPSSDGDGTVQPGEMLEKTRDGAPVTPVELKEVPAELQQQFLDSLGGTPRRRIICDIGGGCANCCEVGGSCCATCNGGPVVCT